MHGGEGKRSTGIWNNDVAPFSRGPSHHSNIPESDGYKFAEVEVVGYLQRKSMRRPPADTITGFLLSPGAERSSPLCMTFGDCQLERPLTTQRRTKETPGNVHCRDPTVSTQWRVIFRFGVELLRRSLAGDATSFFIFVVRDGEFEVHARRSVSYSAWRARCVYTTCGTSWKPLIYNFHSQDVGQIAFVAVSSRGSSAEDCHLS